MENKEKIGRAIRFSALSQINGTALILKNKRRPQDVGTVEPVKQTQEEACASLSPSYQGMK